MDKICQIHDICQISCMKSTSFHEICQISWNPPDFMKSTEFHAWNLLNFMHEICWISCMKSTKFHHEICWISWNPPDFIAMKSAGFHTWNSVDFMPNEPRTIGPIFFNRTGIQLVLNLGWNWLRISNLYFVMFCYVLGETLDFVFRNRTTLSIVNN